MAEGNGPTAEDLAAIAASEAAANEAILTAYSELEPKIDAYSRGVDGPHLRLNKAEGSGDCLFLAVGYQIGKTAEAVRKEVTDRIAEKCAADAGYRGAIEVGENGGAARECEAYVANMKRPLVWGGDPEMAAIKELYGKPILIYQKEGEEIRHSLYDAREGDDPAAAARLTDDSIIRLWYKDAGPNKHYDVVRPLVPVVLPPAQQNSHIELYIVWNERVLIVKYRIQPDVMLQPYEAGSIYLPQAYIEEGESYDDAIERSLNEIGITEGDRRVIPFDRYDSSWGGYGVSYAVLFDKEPTFAPLAEDSRFEAIPAGEFMGRGKPAGDTPFQWVHRDDLESWSNQLGEGNLDTSSGKTRAALTEGILKLNKWLGPTFIDNGYLQRLFPERVETPPAGLATAAPIAATVGRADEASAAAGVVAPVVGRADEASAAAGVVAPVVGRADEASAAAGVVAPVVGRADEASAAAGVVAPVVGRADEASAADVPPAVGRAAPAVDRSLAPSNIDRAFAIAAAARPRYVVRPPDEPEINAENLALAAALLLEATSHAVALEKRLLVGRPVPAGEEWEEEEAPAAAPPPVAPGPTGPGFFRRAMSAIGSGVAGAAGAVRSAAGRLSRDLPPAVAEFGGVPAGFTPPPLPTDVSPATTAGLARLRTRRGAPPAAEPEEPEYVEEEEAAIDLTGDEAAADLPDWVPDGLITKANIKPKCNDVDIMTPDCAVKGVLRNIQIADEFKRKGRISQWDDPKKKRYRELVEKVAELEASDEVKDQQEAGLVREQLKAEFPDIQIRIKGITRALTVPNPYRAMGYREALTSFAEPAGIDLALDPEGKMLAANTQVLHTLVPPKMIADHDLSVALLESLWFCGRNPTLSTDPRCFPARLLGELREWQMNKESEESAKQLWDRLQGSSWPLLRYWIDGLLRAVGTVREEPRLPEEDEGAAPAEEEAAPLVAGRAPAEATAAPRAPATAPLVAGREEAEATAAPRVPATAPLVAGREEAEATAAPRAPAEPAVARTAAAPAEATRAAVELLAKAPGRALLPPLMGVPIIPLGGGLITPLLPRPLAL
jgi:hypothetical protein